MQVYSGTSGLKLIFSTVPKKALVTYKYIALYFSFLKKTLPLRLEPQEDEPGPPTALCGPVNLGSAWARINHLGLLLGRVSFGNGRKEGAKSRESPFFSTALLPERILAIVIGIHFSKRMNYFAAVDISADLRVFSLVSFMNWEQIFSLHPLFIKCNHWECW